MIRRPPRSTLFPTRRSSDLVRSCVGVAGAPATCVAGAEASTTRSEEHTSELQSLRHLVCRLLLEKKKKRSQLACIYMTETAEQLKQDIYTLVHMFDIGLCYT